MKHGLQIFASAMFFAVIVFMVWYMICEIGRAHV